MGDRARRAAPGTARRSGLRAAPRTPRHPVVGGADPRAEVVRRAAAAEDHPAVGRALAVDDQVPVVAERLALAQPDLVPHRVRQRLGGDDQRVDRGDRPAQPGQPRRCSPRSRARRRRPGPCRASVRHRAAARCRGPASARRSRRRALDDVGQPADELGRLDRRAVRGERRAERRRWRPAGRAPRRRRAGRGPARTRSLSATSARARVELRLRSGPARSCRRARCRRRCPRPRPRAHDLGDRVAHGRVLRDRGRRVPTSRPAWRR